MGRSGFHDLRTQRILRLIKPTGLKPVMVWFRSVQSIGMAEKFVSMYKRDNAELAHRPDIQTAMWQLAGWFEHYNTRYPHIPLKYLPPRLLIEKRAVNLLTPMALHERKHY